jgi:hypothetical protein
MQLTIQAYKEALRQGLNASPPKLTVAEANTRILRFIEHRINLCGQD